MVRMGKWIIWAGDSGIESDYAGGLTAELPMSFVIGLSERSWSQEIGLEGPVSNQNWIDLGSEYGSKRSNFALPNAV